MCAVQVKTGEAEALHADKPKKVRKSPRGENFFACCGLVSYGQSERLAGEINQSGSVWIVFRVARISGDGQGWWIKSFR